MQKYQLSGTVLKNTVLFFGFQAAQWEGRTRDKYQCKINNSHHTFRLQFSFSRFAHSLKSQYNFTHFAHSLKSQGTLSLIIPNPWNLKQLLPGFAHSIKSKGVLSLNFRIPQNPKDFYYSFCPFLKMSNNFFLVLTIP